MEFGIMQQPRAGYLVCGDGYLIHERGSQLVVAVADGLGSGEKAYHSSAMTIQGIAENADAALPDILAYCHYTILSASGVGVMVVLLRLDVEAHTLEVSGVGNVRFTAHSKRMIQPIIRFGYLGVRLPSLPTLHYAFDPGDTFVLHTDGISTRFHIQNHLPDLTRGAQPLAEVAMKEYGKAHDDATIVVVKT